MIKNLGILLKTKYDFSWDVLDVIVSGRSSIDAPMGFQIQNAEEAVQFIDNYGYDLSDPIQAAEIQGNFQEALNFIRKNFLQPENPEGLKLDIPRKILEMTGMKDLLLMASGTFPGQTTDSTGQILRHWACSLLKVMHTIAHIDKDLRTPHFSDIQKQIFDRFYKFIHRDEDGKLYLGDAKPDGSLSRSDEKYAEKSTRIALEAFDTKPKKSRDSIILKLLHKPENVAEDIFDRVGMRFVTDTRLGALQVVKFLRDRMIVMSPNIKPSRSRNTLVDLDFFRDGLKTALLKAGDGEMDEKQLLDALEEATRPPSVSPDNPHSSEFYRSIQFTGRQLIKLVNPLYDQLKDLRKLSRDKSEDLAKAFERIDMRYLQREVRFFYPFEVQIVDRHSAEENEKGRSAHSEYKRAQIQTALRRVMGSLVDAVR